MKPVYKKGVKKNMANYRPISLLTSFSKIFEKVIYVRLLKHIDNNSIQKMNYQQKWLCITLLMEY